MFQKLIYATLLSVLWICHSWSMASSSGSEVKRQRVGGVQRIVNIFAGGEGLSAETADANELSQHAYVAVHSAFQTAAKRHGRQLLDDHELLTPLVAGYDSVIPAFPEHIKREHFKNIFILMLATRATLETRGNFFEAPERVAAKIQEWVGVPFLADVDATEVKRILNFFHFPLVYQSVSAAPQELRMNQPIHYSKTKGVPDALRPFPTAAHNPATARRNATQGKKHTLSETVETPPSQHRAGMAGIFGQMGAVKLKDTKAKKPTVAAVQGPPPKPGEPGYAAWVLQQRKAMTTYSSDEDASDMST